MKTASILEELEARNTIIDNRHFIYKSGRHGSAYINLDPIFPDSALMLRLAAALIEPFKGEFDTLVSPAVGGVALVSYCGAAAAQLGLEIEAVWADKHGGDFEVERAGFAQAIRGRRVLLVEDLLTTGSSVTKVANEVRRLDGQLVGLSVVCNRGAITAEAVGVSVLKALSQVQLTSQDADSCSLCAAGRPIVVDIGHGAEYRSNHPGYAGGYELLAN